MIESVKLSQSEQIRIVRIDNIDYALFSNKGVQAYVLPLSKKQTKIPNYKKDKFTNQIRSSRVEAPSTDIASNDQIKKTLDSNTDSKMLRAISIARKLNPKVSF